MLRLFGGMPTPHGAHAGLGGGKPAVVAQGSIGKHGGAMLVRGGDRQQVARVDAVVFAKLYAPRRPMLPAVDQALLFQLRVVQRVHMTVGGFLTDELCAGVAQGGVFFKVWQQAQSPTHRVNKRLLTHRETHGQRVVILAAKSIATMPVAFKTRLQIHQEFSNGQRVRCVHAAPTSAWARDPSNKTPGWAACC